MCFARGESEVIEGFTVGVDMGWWSGRMENDAERVVFETEDQTIGWFQKQFAKVVV